MNFSTTFVTGMTVAFTVRDVGFPAATLSESGALPDGVTFDPMNGILSGTPSAGTAGSYNLTFRARNGSDPDAVDIAIWPMGVV